MRVAQQISMLQTIGVRAVEKPAELIILRRIGGYPLFSGKFNNVKECVEAAIKQQIDLSDAFFMGYNLQGIDFSGMKLTGIDLRNANLIRALFLGCDCSKARFDHARLYMADFTNAELIGATFHNAHATDALFDHSHGSFLQPNQTKILPEGVLIGWKQCKGNILVKIEIPAEAKRSNATGRKCRAEYVKVLQVFGKEPAISKFDSKTEYRAGAIVRADSWDADWSNECSNGIHFFITQEEAEEYR